MTSDLSTAVAALSAFSIMVAIANTAWVWLRAGRARAVATATAKTVAADTAAEVEALTERIARAEKDLEAHKLKVASDYVSIALLEKTEGRLMLAIADIASAIRGLGERLDRVVDHARK